MKKEYLLFLVILIEGYVVLAAELLAIRQLIPFVGSGVETTAIIISGVLLPLAMGYHFGGIAYARAFKKAKEVGKTNTTIRGILIRNIMTSLVFMVFGFSYVFQDAFFGLLRLSGVHHHLVHTGLYVVFFLITPMFLLGQTVPLTSHYFSHRKLSGITGKMLFFSTMGAFLGSLFSTLVLMPYFGVHYTVVITLGLLLVLLWLIAGKKARRARYVGLLVFCFAWFVNGTPLMRGIFIVSDNAYNTVAIKKAPNQEDLLLFINRSLAGLYSDKEENRLEYIKYVEKYFIQPYLAEKGAPRDILSLGAGGFDLGRHDSYNNYTFVDIDKELKELAEEHLWKKQIQPNKSFVASSARQFVHSDIKKYDLILIDVCTNAISMPMEVITQEFLQEVKARLKKGGVVVANIVSSPSFGDAFSVRYYNTFASVFPMFNRTVIEQKSLQGDAEEAPTYSKMTNTLHIYVDHDYVSDRVIYTDDKNTYSMDIP